MRAQSSRPTPGRRFVRIAIIALMIPVVIVGALFFLVMSLVAFPVACLHRRRLWRRFYREHNGAALFVWGSRHGWHDFVVNNVLPVLPGQARSCHEVRRSEDDWKVLLKALREKQNRAEARPYLALVGRNEVEFVSLNGPLRLMKQHARRDPSVQRHVGQLIGDVIRTRRAETCS